ncbi:AAC(3) family N-acetyltransferase [Pseudogemmobacter sp. W21_MBD1_M6]|uniref:AAC(3) family N-acetyltransferase n=1 Tax=Pseudogemmobacter sp. W21_MBD1_M6 TaxID=3240271 RepID=UPI003F9E126B
MPELAEYYSQCGIAEGGVLLVHSSISRTLKTFCTTPNDVISALQKAVGSEGTLLFPLFNFDFTSGVPFDINTTESQMGALTNAARLWPGAVRTGHPIYSFAAIGAGADHFEGLTNHSGYGPDSPFAKLTELDGQIAVIDLPDQNSMTFYHHVEEKLSVPYRFHKNFSGPYTDASGHTEERTFSIFVRDIEKGVRTSVDRMGKRLWDLGLYSGQLPGDGCGMRVIGAKALFEETKAVIEQGKALEYLYDLER